MKAIAAFALMVAASAAVSLTIVENIAAQVEDQFEIVADQFDKALEGL